MPTPVKKTPPAKATAIVTDVVTDTAAATDAVVTDTQNTTDAHKTTDTQKPTATKKFVAKVLGAATPPPAKRTFPAMTVPPPRRTIAPADPPFLGVAGDSDAGKTVDFGFSFPFAMWLADAGGLEPVRSLCGYDPRDQTVKGAETVDDLTAAIDMAIENGYHTLIIDDASAKFQTSYTLHEASAPVGNSGAPDGYYAYQQLLADTMRFRARGRTAGIGVVMNFWLDRPKTNNKGKLKKGGPAIPGIAGKEALIVLLDLMLRCDKDPARQPWPGIYRRDPGDNSWLTKDRYSIGVRELPMNVGEILRYAGFDLAESPWKPARLYDWQEEVVDAIAVEMWRSGSEGDASIGRAWVAKLAESGATASQIRWTLRDAVDRVTIWRLVPRADNIASEFGW